MFVFADECKEENLTNGVLRRIKGSIRDLMVVELRWKPGMAGEAHAHPHRQCAYVVSGSFEAVVAGEKAVLRAGDCMYIESGVEHSLIALEEGVLLDIFTPRRDDFLTPPA